MKIERVMIKIWSVPTFFYEKINENNPLTTPLIKIDLHPSAILFIYVLSIHPRSLTNLKCLILEKLELKVKNDFSQFRIFHPFLQNNSENTGDTKKIMEYRIVAFVMTKIFLCVDFL